MTFWLAQSLSYDTFRMIPTRILAEVCHWDQHSAPYPTCGQLSIGNQVIESTLADREKLIGEFPTRRKPLSFHSPLTDRTDVVGFNEIFLNLTTLKLGVYTPVSYILPSRLSRYEDLYDTEVSGGGGKLKQIDREKSLRSLMTVNLLKRLESSVHSFRITLKKLQQIHISTLSRIENFRKTGQDGTFADISPSFEDASPDEDIDFLDPEDLPSDQQTEGKVNIQLQDMDLPSWEHDLQADLAVIETLLGEMEKVSPADDAKLQHLKEHILAKIDVPINPGNRKVLVFTAFADTADYLYEHLAPVLRERYGVHTGRVVGSERPKSTLTRRSDFQELLMLFSPVSKEKALLLPEVKDEIDLLIATDCISEGQNLQDCDYLINYDIHWNPVRIIQRFGRIDRIGSKNASIQLVNYWPDISLDEYIRLKERVESRMVIADVTATGDDNPLDGKSNDLAYRKEQLRRMQEEVIELEDLKAGVSITDLGLNDFRMDLLNYVKTAGDLSKLPSGMHAVLPAAPERGLVPGAIFALRNRNESINISQLNRLYPYYLVYVGMNGETILPYTEVKCLLDLVRSVAKPCEVPIPEAYVPFNIRTQDGREMRVYPKRSATPLAQPSNSARFHSKRWSPCRNSPAGRVSKTVLYSAFGVVKTTCVGRANSKTMRSRVARRGASRCSMTSTMAAASNPFRR